MSAEQDRLSRLAEISRVTLSPPTNEALLAYGRLLLEWNQRINLTGAKSLADLIEDHFSDAFAVAPQLAGTPRGVDVGSGAGLPAIPAAILSPGASLLLVEPIRKKVSFLRTAIRALGLGPRLAVVPRRLEDAGPPIAASPFDVAMSRATFEPSAWLSRGLPLVRQGGKVLALTSTPTAIVPAGLAMAESIRYGSTPPRWLLVLIRST